MSGLGPQVYGGGEKVGYWQEEESQLVKTVK